MFLPWTTKQVLFFCLVEIPDQVSDGSRDNPVSDNSSEEDEAANPFSGNSDDADEAHHDSSKIDQGVPNPASGDSGDQGGGDPGSDDGETDNAEDESSCDSDTSEASSDASTETLDAPLGQVHHFYFFVLR